MRFLPTMQLKVELFAGTDIAEAARDLCELANRIGTLCEAKFNGVHLWARPGDSPAALVAAWDAQMKRPASAFKIAQARDTSVAEARCTAVRCTCKPVEMLTCRRMTDGVPLPAAQSDPQQSPMTSKEEAR